MTPNDDANWIYPGFGPPTYTQVPDDFFDEIAPHLSEAELRVLIYIIRRTFGFKKLADAVSINQLVSGIVTGEGKRLDWGTGMSRSAVRRGTVGLVKKGLITLTREKSESGEYETNVYVLRFREQPVGLESAHPLQEVGLQEAHPMPPKDPPVGLQKALQETVVQETVVQEDRFEYSKDPTQEIVIKMNDRVLIGRYIEDLARELRDQASLASSTTRACRVYIASGVSLDDFTTAMLEARRKTQEASTNIRKVAPDGLPGEKSKMSYWFRVLEDLVGVRRLDATG